ncbi:MAG: c-type cytochrome [candidate division NC10 bacterium]|nr:c-type cytochrome [candidate division NC10 bacterium]
MSAKAAKWIFYLGTLISLVLFLGLTVDTHRQIKTLTHTDKLSEQVVAGKRVWQKYNCNDCHTILGFGSYYAPDMTKVYWRRGSEGIKAVVRTPERFTTWRKMPHLGLTDLELQDLVAFLQWVSEIDTQDWPPQDQKLRAAAGRAVALGVSPGATLFQEKGCFACHRLYGTGGMLGPELTHVGSRRTYETIERILTDPRSVNPQATMPTPPLSHEERDELGRFLAGMK